MGVCCPPVQAPRQDPKTAHAVSKTALAERKTAKRQDSKTALAERKTAHAVSKTAKRQDLKTALAERKTAKRKARGGFIFFISS